MGLSYFVNLYIEYGADINKSGRFLDLLHKKEKKRQVVEGITPVMVASFYGHFEVVNILARNGADIQRTDMFKRKAIDYAIADGNPKVIELLKK